MRNIGLEKEDWFFHDSFCSCEVTPISLVKRRGNPEMTPFLKFGNKDSLLVKRIKQTNPAYFLACNNIKRRNKKLLQYLVRRMSFINSIISGLNQSRDSRDGCLVVLHVSAAVADRENVPGRSFCRTILCQTWRILSQNLSGTD